MTARSPDELGSARIAGTLPVRSSLSHRLVTISVLTVCALGVSLMAKSGLGGILLVIVAGLLPWMLPAAPAVAWLIGQNILLVIVINDIPGIVFSDAATTGGIFLGISLFAFMSGEVSLRQHIARDALRKVNSELRATQALLADNTRIADLIVVIRSDFKDDFTLTGVVDTIGEKQVMIQV